jgi:hypothetical protein
MGKARKQIQNKMEGFIELGYNKVISYYIIVLINFIKTYDLNITEPATRKSLSVLIENIYSSNHHVCTTTLKKSSAFKHSSATDLPYYENIIVIASSTPDRNSWWTSQHQEPDLEH